MYIRRKVFSKVMDENGEEKLFSVTQKEFGAKERKQNKKLVDAQKNAQMQAGRASKAQARVDKMAEILKGGGKLTGKYKDMYENGGYKADVDAAVKKTGATSEKAAQHAKSAEQAAGRVGTVATKMSKKRTSLKEGKELSIQSGNHKGGLKVKMEDQKTLGDIKGKNKKTVVKTEGKTVATQGGGKQTTKTVLSEAEQKKVNKQQKVVDAKGKELPKKEIKRDTKVVASAPKTEIKMETPNKNIKVAGSKVQTEIKKDAKKLGKAGKVGLGIAGAAALGAGLVAAKKMKDKKDEAKKAAVKEFAEKEDSKAEKVAKAATIGGATVGLGAGAAGLGAEIGRKKVKKATNQLEKEKANIFDKAKKATAGGKTIPALTKNQEADLEIKKAAQKKLQKIDKVLEKVSKKSGKVGVAGVGASVTGALAYKALKKKNEDKK